MHDLSEITLKKLAGDVTYRRGLDYFKSGAVEEIRIKGNIISATVIDSMPYQVTVTRSILTTMKSGRKWQNRLAPRHQSVTSRQKVICLKN